MTAPLLPISIRRMTLDDLEEVVQLDRASFSLPWPDSSFKYEIEKNECSRCWVVEIEREDGKKQLAGMIVAWLIVDEVHIATFAVREEYRRQGIASRLLAHTLLDAAKSGGEKGFLEVRRGNLAARALYQKFGIVEIGVRKKYYQDNGEDAILMNLDHLEIRLLESLV